MLEEYSGRETENTKGFFVPRRSSRTIAAGRLFAVGHRLRQCVLGDVRAWPDRVQQLLLGHECAGPIEQVEQQVERFGRQRQLS